MNQTQLTTYLERHDGVRVIRSTPGAFVVECNAVDKDGVLFLLVETIEASYEAVRGYLGY